MKYIICCYKLNIMRPHPRIKVRIKERIAKFDQFCLLRNLFVNYMCVKSICKIDSKWEFAVWIRKLKQGLFINVGGEMEMGMGGRFKREVTNVYLWQIHIAV